MNILRASIEDLQQMMSSGLLTSEKLVRFYSDRIIKYNADINAVAEVAPDALRTARALDKERKEKTVRGPLHGIPILIKDNIDTHDPLHTTGGTVALKNNIAAQDAFIIKKLRDAGAVILGKTNMSELANFVSMQLPNGFSAGGGQVKNPLGNYEIGGSSSGSAAAAACGFAAAAIGTETSGSIVMPASLCALAALKPTVGRLSSSGIIPLAPTQDTAGPMAKYVSDVRILYEAMAFSTTEPFDENTRDLSGLRIGVLTEPYNSRLDTFSKNTIHQAISLLASCFATLVPIPENYFFGNDDLTEDLTIMLYEFKASINEYLKNTSADCPVHSLTELIQFNEDHREIAIPYGQDILIKSEKTSGLLTESEYRNARRHSIKTARKNSIDAAMREYRLAAIVAPSYFAYDFPARAGYPSMTLPIGFSKEYGAVSLLFFGQAGTEEVILRICEVLERVLPDWRSDIPAFS